MMYLLKVLSCIILVFLILTYMFLHYSRVCLKMLLSSQHLRVTRINFHLGGHLKDARVIDTQQRWPTPRTLSVGPSIHPTKYIISRLALLQCRSCYPHQFLLLASGHLRGNGRKLLLQFYQAPGLFASARAQSRPPLDSTKRPRHHHRPI